MSDNKFTNSSLRQPRLASSAASRKGTGEAKLRGNTVDAVSRVQVLNHDHLVAGGGTLARGDDGPGEEKFPDLSTVSTNS